ncbi:MAG: Dam family site-specific DNA-(adenine-N6)-methyltransferase [Chloroflexota bacterium]|nr:Dam family site-specific DNA-(adenine-N6)-methyltransferase [Chloroflexota bacterium]
MYEQAILNGFELQVKGAPFVRWAGGKRSLLKYLLPLVPSHFGRYYEPFLGGGALFFALQPARAQLSDSNADLINCYIQVRDNPEAVINELRQLKNTADEYYKIRGDVPEDCIAQAARFIYLMALSFNGIHRLNGDGKFNVPYNHKPQADYYDPQRIRAASVALASAKLSTCDFEQALTTAEGGDLIYFDPPYTVAHGNNGFIEYNAKIFSWTDQIKLAQLATELKDRGCAVIVSNADHPSILELYKEFQVKRVSRSSGIAASGKYRRQVTEYIFYNEVKHSC